jgi:hypothetical protein
MSPPGHQDDFDPLPMGAAESCQIRFRNLKLRVEHSAVDVSGQQTDGRFQHRRF